MMMIMVYALHDEKEEREILKKIKIIYFNKGYRTVFYNLCDGFLVLYYINNILLISFKGKANVLYSSILPGITTSKAPNWQTLIEIIVISSSSF